MSLTSPTAVPLDDINTIITCVCNTSEEKGNTDRAEAAADCSYDISHTRGEKRSYAALLEWLY